MLEPYHNHLSTLEVTLMTTPATPAPDQLLSKDYADWLAHPPLAETVNGIELVTTPLLDRHNDFISYAVQKTPDGFLLSDLGETLADLTISGLAPKAPEHRNALSAKLRTFDVTLSESGELTIATPDPTRPDERHRLMRRF